MRRIILVLTVAVVMAAMMVSAGPAQANDLNFGNSNNFVQFGNGLVGFGDIDDDDEDFDGIFGCCRHHNGIDFDDIDDNDVIFGFGGFGGDIDQDSRSGSIRIG
jgi:hypothetical protein